MRAGDRLVSGRGASTDILEASARAYLGAINRAVSLGKGKVRRTVSKKNRRRRTK